MTSPTPQDLDNSETRRRIAEEFQNRYNQVLRWAMGKFGPGWLPSHRHELIEKEEEDRCRHTGERPKPAYTVYTVKNSIGRQRHFTVDAEGRVHECASYEEGFGSMLLEPHSTRGFTDKAGVFHHTHRYSLCWADFPLYEPKSADELVAMRERRQEKAVEKEAEANPLFADQIREQGYVPKPRRR